MSVLIFIFILHSLLYPLNYEKVLYQRFIPLDNWEFKAYTFLNIIHSILQLWIHKSFCFNKADDLVPNIKRNKQKGNYVLNSEC